MNPKRHFISILLFTLFCASVVFIKSFDKRARFSTEGPVMTVTRDAALSSDATSPGAVAMPLRAGEKVRMLGYEGIEHHLRYLVETEGGFRGYVWPWDVDLPVIATYYASILEYKADTLTNLTGETQAVSGSICAKWIRGQLKNGKEVKVDFGELRPAFDAWRDFRLSADLSASRYVSREKFEKEIMGQSIARVEDGYSPSVYLLMDSGGFVGRQRIGVFDSETGDYYYPKIFYGPDSLARSVSYVLYFKSGLGTAAKYVPFMTYFTDLPLTSYAARSSLYEPEVAHWWQSLLKRIWNIAVMIMWICLPVLIPAKVVSMLLFVPIMRKIPNTAVKWALICVTLITSYYWVQVLIPYQASSGVIMMAIIYNVTLSMLVGKIVLGVEGDHNRCPECRHMYSIIEIDRELLDAYHEKEIVKEKYHITNRSLVGKKTTTSTLTDESGRCLNKSVHETYYYDVKEERDIYEETWRVMRERVFCQCVVCGFKEDRVEKSRHRVQRDHIGKDVKKYIEES